MSNYIEVRDAPDGSGRTYKIHLDRVSMAMVKLNDFDELLFDDIQNGEKSKTPLADRLLGLETLVRRIEEQGL